MADEDLRTMVREFRESMTSAIGVVTDKIEENGRRIEENGRRIEENGRRIEENGRRIEENGRRIDELDTRVDEQGNELRHRISVAETAILNTIRDQARLFDRRTSRLEARVDRIEDRLDLPDGDPPAA